MKFGESHSTYSFADSWGSKICSAVDHEQNYREYICKENTIIYNTIFTEDFIKTSFEKYILKEQKNLKTSRDNIHRRFEKYLDTHKDVILSVIKSRKSLWYNEHKEGLLIRVILIPYITKFLFSPKYEAKASRHNVICMYVNRAYYLLFEELFNKDYIQFYIDRDEF